MGMKTYNTSKITHWLYFTDFMLKIKVIVQYRKLLLLCVTNYIIFFLCIVEHLHYPPYIN